ncbi:MAG: DUF1294 domain-containing protein [Thiomonas sp.]
MQFEGCLRQWNAEKGYGFITPDRGDHDIFIHIKAFAPNSGIPRVGQRLRFSVEVDAQGRRRAVQVLGVGENRPERRRAPRQPTQQRNAGLLLLIPAFVVLCSVLSLLWTPPKHYIPFYLIASAVCFLAYAIDKAAAMNQSWRTAESTLHVLSLIGGWPGALLAQQAFRHKTVKPEFRTVFWATVILNVLGLVALSFPLGHDILPTI